VPKKKDPVSQTARTISSETPSRPGDKEGDPSPYSLIAEHDPEVTSDWSGPEIDVTDLQDAL
jgi:hypothetical protein